MAPGTLTGDHPRTIPLCRCQQSDSGTTQWHISGSSLRVPQVQHGPLQIHVLPRQRENLIQSATGQQQQADSTQEPDPRRTRFL